MKSFYSISFKIEDSFHFKMYQTSVYATLIAFFLNLMETGSVEIRKLSVPRWVENGTEHPVALDCDYIYNENDLRLVVKWFFQDNSEPVYQWIPELNLKHTSGLLRNRLDLNFAVNTVDPYCKYRALRIVQPSIELTGKYTCVVTSLAGQDSKEQTMTVFVPAQDFELTYSEKVREGEVNVSCKAWNVFPFPQLKLFLYSSSDSPPQTVSSATIVTEKKPSGAFNVLLHRTFIVSELANEEGAVFECLLHLPGTNYTQSKKLAYLTDSKERKLGSPHGLSFSSSNYVHIFSLRTIICFILTVIVTVT